MPDILLEVHSLVVHLSGAAGAAVKCEICPAWTCRGNADSECLGLGFAIGGSLCDAEGRASWGTTAGRQRGIEPSPESSEPCEEEDLYPLVAILVSQPDLGLGIGELATQSLRVFALRANENGDPPHASGAVSVDILLGPLTTAREREPVTLFSDEGSDTCMDLLISWFPAPAGMFAIIQNDTGPACSVTPADGMKAAVLSARNNRGGVAGYSQSNNASILSGDGAPAASCQGIRQKTKTECRAKAFVNTSTRGDRGATSCERRTFFGLYPEHGQLSPPPGYIGFTGFGGAGGGPLWPENGFGIRIVAPSEISRDEVNGLAEQGASVSMAFKKDVECESRTIAASPKCLRQQVRPRSSVLGSATRSAHSGEVSIPRYLPRKVIPQHIPSRSCEAAPPGANAALNVAGREDPVLEGFLGPYRVHKEVGMQHGANGRGCSVPRRHTNTSAWLRSSPTVTMPCGDQPRHLARRIGSARRWRSRGADLPLAMPVVSGTDGVHVERMKLTLSETHAY